MKKTYTLAVLLLMIASLQAVAQIPSEGALQTDDGFVVYVNNSQGTSYTLDLHGDVNLADFPLIRDNGKFYHISMAPKEVFGADDESRLKRYMDMEVRKLNTRYKEKAMITPNMKNVNGTLFNIWRFLKPDIDTTLSENKLVATYYLDFVKDSSLFRITYPSTSLDDVQVRKFLYRIYRQMHFYENLDVEKLHYYIAQGQNYYNE